MHYSKNVQSTVVTYHVVAVLIFIYRMGVVIMTTDIPIRVGVKFAL